MFESTAHQSLFKAQSCTTRFGIIFTRKAKTIYMSINILLKFILSTSVQCSTTKGFQFNLWPLQTSLLPLRAMVSCISRTRDFWLKISAKRCGLYTSFYGMLHIHFPCFVSLWFKEQDTDTLYSTKNNFVSLCTITCKNSGDMSTQHFGQLNFGIRWHNCRWLDQFQCTFH